MNEVNGTLLSRGEIDKWGKSWAFWLQIASLRAENEHIYQYIIKNPADMMKKKFFEKNFFWPIFGNFGDFLDFLGVKNPKKIEKNFLTGIDQDWSEMHFKP